MLVHTRRPSLTAATMLAAAAQGNRRSISTNTDTKALVLAWLNTIRQRHRQQPARQANRQACLQHQAPYKSLNRAIDQHSRAATHQSCHPPAPSLTPPWTHQCLHTNKSVGGWTVCATVTHTRQWPPLPAGASTAAAEATAYHVHWKSLQHCLLPRHAAHAQGTPEQAAACTPPTPPLYPPTCDAHRDAHIRGLEGGRVVHAVASHGHRLPQLLQGPHDLELVLRAGARKHVALLDKRPARKRRGGGKPMQQVDLSSRGLNSIQVLRQCQSLA